MGNRDKDFEDLLERSSLRRPGFQPGQRSQRAHVESVRQIVELRRRMMHAAHPGDADAAAIELSQLLRELGYDDQAEHVLQERFRKPETQTIEQMARVITVRATGGAAQSLTSSDEPVAVVAVGPLRGERRAVLEALLGVHEPELQMSGDGYLVVNYRHAASRVAYVPGYREPRPHITTTVPAPMPRPARRVELGLPNPLLRHFVLVDAPDSETLGVAGRRVVLDAARRGGALLFVISADQSISRADLHLLAEVAEFPVRPYFVVTSSAQGGSSVADEPTVEGELNSATVARDAQRAVLLSAVPSLAHAPWFALDPAAGDIPHLRRALVGWAADEGLRRAGANRQVTSVPESTVQSVSGRQEPDRIGRLDRLVRASVQRIRQHVALELANIHLRCVQELVFGVGPSGIPELLDRELHALSLFTTAQCASGVTSLLQDNGGHVSADARSEAVGRRPASGDPTGSVDRVGQDLDTLLLVTGSATVTRLAGPGMVAALSASQRDPGGEILPPVGVALSSSCYRDWRNLDEVDSSRARSWLQRALREVETALSREVSRRFEALRLALTSVVGDPLSAPGPDHDPHSPSARSVDADAASVADGASAASSL
ncbi:hypothetical protein AB0C15_21660 [Micromonospora sp. NPDC048835]|uniref:hypothetical protein n=1 Tax=Micromonospora sp. NPDC048835 TaxID=3155147 RepID=UPI0034049839